MCDQKVEERGDGRGRCGRTCATCTERTTCPASPLASVTVTALRGSSAEPTQAVSEPPTAVDRQPQ